MAGTVTTPIFRVIERKGPCARLLLRRDADDGTEFIVISGYRGTPLPDCITRPEFNATGGAGNASSGWRLTCTEGEYAFHARAIDRIDLRPGLFEPMHAAFALSAADRIAVRLLLRALRFPGGARILRWWQSRR
jgi:hypothetical protein